MNKEGMIKKMTADYLDEQDSLDLEQWCAEQLAKENKQDMQLEERMCNLYIRMVDARVVHIKLPLHKATQYISEWQVQDSLFISIYKPYYIHWTIECNAIKGMSIILV